MTDKPIQAKLRDWSARRHLKRGEFDFPSRASDNQPKRLRFACPRCGQIQIIGLCHKDGINVGPHWSLFGPEESPTLTPFITTACGWTGGLIEGIWQPGHIAPVPDHA